MPRKSGGSGAPRSEAVITVRLPQKVRFGLELLARKQHRTISSIVTEAIERTIKEANGLTVLISPMAGEAQERAFIPDKAWDPREPDRLVKLARLDTNLLDYEEEFRWRIIGETKRYWRAGEPNFELIRQEWAAICEAASEQMKTFGQ